MPVLLLVLAFLCFALGYMGKPMAYAGGMFLLWVAYRWMFNKPTPPPRISELEANEARAEHMLDKAISDLKRQQAYDRLAERSKPIKEKLKNVQVWEVPTTKEEKEWLRKG